jgi:hypothetical protein
MNKFKCYFILLITTVSFFSCTKNSVPVVPPREFSAQYATDVADIEEYLKTNFITVIDHPGFVDDQDITISKITAGETSIWDQKVFELKSREVSLHDITYKIYYLVLRQGVGNSPSNVDGVLAAYKGNYLQRVTLGTDIGVFATDFEKVQYPQQFLSLLSTISGWGEIFPQFKTGTNTSNDDGTINHSDFGAGVMFLPSGLGYFNTGSGVIPAYAPLVFSFKLFEVQRLDQDGDGILSYLEDLNGDNYIKTLATGVVNPDDTDGDGILDFLDKDDDGDNYSTALEIKNSATGIAYPFADIPTCTSGKKNYLDVTCHP